MINIIVCVKQVLDPELPVSLFKINADTKKVIPPRGRSPVLNPFDENALEAALKIKDSEEAKITVVSMGSGLDEMVLRETIAVGADELVLLDDAGYKDADSYSTASVLAAAIKKIGEYDLILCGRQAADTNAGQVGIALASILDIPVVTLCRKLETGSGVLKIERIIEDGHEVIETPMPALVTVSYEVGLIREASFEGTTIADEKEITMWDSEELGIDTSGVVSGNIRKLTIPEHGVECQFIQGTTPEETGEKLAMQLREKQIL